MTHKTLNSRHALEYQFNTWKPFQLQTLSSTTTDLSNQNSPNNNKRPCLYDRSFSIDTLDMSKLSLFEEDRTSIPSSSNNNRRDKFQWIARKRRRRGSRSVSGGRSSDKSGTRRLSVGASAGTDSSGELFVHGDVNWSSDVSEAKISRKDGSSSEKELVVGTGYWQIGGFVDAQGNESGYGSEPGYRGDAEFGYGDEFDEEEEDARLLFWGERSGGGGSICQPSPFAIDGNTEVEGAKEGDVSSGRVGGIGLGSPGLVIVDSAVKSHEQDVDFAQDSGVGTFVQKKALAETAVMSPIDSSAHSGSLTQKRFSKKEV